MTAASPEPRFIDEGTGAPILILPGGMNDPSQWKRVADRLVPRFRVIRLHRRQYRMDLNFGRPVTIPDEVEDVVAVAEQLDRPVLLVGHSSGAVVALEAMVAAPQRFAGAVLYEPPAVIDVPLGGKALTAARAALDAGKPGKALSIFVRDIVRVPRWMAPLTRAAMVMPRFRSMVGRQLDDAEAIDALGVRLAAYADIDIPTMFLLGDRSPAHLAVRAAAVAAVMPDVRVRVLHGQGHGANVRAAPDVARHIAELADDVFGR